MHEVHETGITLELFPSSNIHNKKVRNVAELKYRICALRAVGVRTVVNTDGSDIYQTNMEKEEMFLVESDIMLPRNIEASCVRA